MYKYVFNVSLVRYVFFYPLKSKQILSYKKYMSVWEYVALVFVALQLLYNLFSLFVIFA